MSEDPDFAERQSNELPRSQDVLRAISISGSSEEIQRDEDERSFKEATHVRAIQAQLKYAHLRGVQDHYRQKGRWSFFLMAAVGGMLLFQSGLLIFVGVGWLDFQKYEWLLPALLVQNLGQVIGLAVFAVKYLFSDISEQG